MPMLSNCCFCLDLRVGCLIIGVLNLLNSIVMTLTFAILAVMLVLTQTGAKAANDGSFKDLLAGLPGNASELFDDYADVADNDKAAMELVMENLDVVKNVVLALLAVSVLLLIASSCLIHGVRNKRRGMLVPYMIQELINIAVFLGLIIINHVYLGSHEVAIYFSLSVGGGLLIHLYFLLVVISQYQALGLIRMHEEISMKP